MKDKFRHLTLLYIEDDRETRANALEFMEMLFDTIYLAQDGVEGYDSYQKYLPDIILSDIKMPKMGGLELARKIRKEDKSIPIIITTAYSTESLLLEAIELSLTKYILKPMNQEKIYRALDMAYLQIFDTLVEEIVLTKRLTYNVKHKNILEDDKLLMLTKSEIKLLDLLVKYKGSIVTYQQIEHVVWYERMMTGDALRAVVRTLRKKMGEDIIYNITGVGYLLR